MSKAAYDDIADWYDRSIRSGSLQVFHEFAIAELLDLTPSVQDAKVLDLACGQGIVSRKVAEAGAAVVGADASLKMLDIARNYEQSSPVGIEYVREDARSLRSIADGTFDGVVCNMALMDIPDLNSCFTAVARVLKPGGWLVFSVTHPCFINPDVARWSDNEPGAVGPMFGGYFSEGFYRTGNPEGVRGKVGAYHRTVSTYVNLLSDAGLVVERLVEPKASPKLAECVPHTDRMPPIMLIRCGKVGT